MSDVDVVVAGGGHAGLMLAGGLLRLGFGVALVDPTPAAAIRAAPPDGRTLALMAGSRLVAERLGLWTSLAPVTSPIWRVEVEDAASAARVGYRAAEDLHQPFGYGVENRRLRAALLDAVLAAGGEGVLRPSRVVAFVREPGALRVELEDGTSLRTALLVGADGRGSGVRALARIGLERWTYRQTALAFVAGHERPHGHTVRERLRSGGPLALLPLPEDGDGAASADGTAGVSGVTWVEPHGTAEALVRAGEAALGETLTELFGDALGRCRVVGPVGRWPLGAQHATRYVAPRLALVGDAAHGVHPLAGQGVNLGFGDARALAQVLAARGPVADPGAPVLLDRYARRRAEPVLAMQAATDGLARLFGPSTPWLSALRNAGMTAVDRLPLLKRALAQPALR